MVDWNKPIQTRDGCSARLICQDKKGGDYPVVVLVVKSEDEEHMVTYTSDGRFFRDATDTDDIINVPEKPLTYKEWFTMYGVCGFSAAVAENYADYRVQFDRENR